MKGNDKRERMNMERKSTYEYRKDNKDAKKAIKSGCQRKNAAWNLTTVLPLYSTRYVGLIICLGRIFYLQLKPVLIGKIENNMCNLWNKNEKKQKYAYHILYNTMNIYVSDLPPVSDFHSYTS